MISTEKRSFVSIIVGILISSTVLKNLKVPRTLAMGVVAALVLAGMAGSAGALSNSGGGSWQYSKDITISNPGGALSDYQVLVNLTSSNFPTNAQASGADIRFTDAGGAELSYWIENWDYAGRSANTWVKVPSVGVGATTIRMWYGNPSATSDSNGTGTFDLFDNFDGASLDASKWDVNTGANYSISGGNIKIKGQGSMLSPEWHFGKPSIYSKSSFNDYTIGVRVSQDLDNSLGDINYWLMDATHYYAIQHETRTAGADNDFVFNDGSTRGIFADYRYEWNVNEWVRYTLKIHSSVLDFERVSETDATRKVAGINIGNSKNFATTGRKIGLSGDGALSGSNFVVDWIFVRKYAFPEPSVSVGAEQSIGPTTIPPTTVPPTTVPPKADTTPAKFRVGPTVNLRPVTEVVERNQDGIVELYMDNPLLNDVTLTVEARITVPSGIHVYGQGFGLAGAAGVVMGQFEVPPGTARTISVNIKADESARIGSHSIKFTGLYYPGSNKDNYQPISLTYGVTVKEPSKKPEEPPKEAQATASPSKIPGFGVVLAIFGVFAIARLLSRK